MFRFRDDTSTGDSNWVIWWQKKQKHLIAQVESTLQQAVNQVRTSSAAPFVDSFFFDGDSDDSCPQWYSNQDGHIGSIVVQHRVALFEGYEHYIHIQNKWMKGNQ